jgi:hypothetical protein
MVLAIVPSLVPSGTQVQAPAPNASVHLVLVNFMGNGMNGPMQVDEFRSMDNGRDFAQAFDHGIASEIPYGRYHLRVQSEGFWPTDKTVDVKQATVWIIAVMELGMGETEGGRLKSSVSGRIVNITADSSPILVRLSGIFSEFSLDVRVGATGEFEFNAVPLGKYTLTTTRDGEVLDVRIIKLNSLKGFQVNINGGWHALNNRF